MPHHHHRNPNDQKYISKRRVADRYGKNVRTITRWVGDAKLHFVQPVMINRRWYFEEAKLDEFDRRLALALVRDLARCHQAEDKIKHAQRNLTLSYHAGDKTKVAQAAGGEA